MFDHLHATAFQYSPLGRTVQGPVSNIQALGREQLLSYLKANYRGPRIVRVIAAAAAGAAGTGVAAAAARGSAAAGTLPRADAGP